MSCVIKKFEEEVRKAANNVGKDAKAALEKFLNKDIQAIRNNIGSKQTAMLKSPLGTKLTPISKKLAPISNMLQAVLDSASTKNAKPVVSSKKHGDALLLDVMGVEVDAVEENGFYDYTKAVIPDINLKDTDALRKDLYRQAGDQFDSKKEFDDAFDDGIKYLHGSMLLDIVQVHEIVHSVTADYLLNNPDSKTTQDLTTLYEYAVRVANKQDGGEEANWKLSIDEFIAEAMTNPEVIALLAQMPNKTSVKTKSTVFEALVDSLLKLLKLDKAVQDSVHEAVVGLYENIVAIENNDKADYVGTRQGDVNLHVSDATFSKIQMFDGSEGFHVGTPRVVASYKEQMYKKKDVNLYQVENTKSLKTIELTDNGAGWNIDAVRDELADRGYTVSGKTWLTIRKELVKHGIDAIVYSNESEGPLDGQMNSMIVINPDVVKIKEVSGKNRANLQESNSLLVPVKVNSDVRISKGFTAKDETHLTVLGFPQGKELTKLFAESPELKAKLEKLIENADFSYTLKDDVYRIERDREAWVDWQDQSKGKENIHEEAVIQLVDAPGVEKFIGKANKLLGTNFPVPFPHISLATKGSKLGIGIADKTAFDALTKERLDSTSTAAKSKLSSAIIDEINNCVG